MPYPISKIPNMNFVNRAMPTYDQKTLSNSILAKDFLFTGLSGAAAFFWTYKTFVIGGVVIGVALLILKFYWSRPQKPMVTLASTANVARLTIHTLMEKPIAINATLTFCVDLSSSMNEKGRSDAVKKALNDVLNNAQKVVNDKLSKTAIEIAIVGFNDKATVIAEKVKLVRNQGSKENRVVEEVKRKIDGLNFNGSTKIIAGLEEATKQLVGMAKRNKKGSHTLILLTDGEETIDANALKPIHAQLATNKVALFAIGIGQEHDKQTLAKITTSMQTGFQGTYIDTTGIETIETAVSKAYTQALSSFNNLILTAPALKSLAWSVLHTPMTKDKDGLRCSLGSLAVGEKLVKIIKIHGSELPAPLDLSSVMFELSFKDPKGRQGTMSLPWNPNTILNPEILSAAI